jgi:4-aminobutyrate aminotransferase/4-aminobutyrate aminotransferase/(S)-3-amino-2-methylpropionate transaminase
MPTVESLQQRRTAAIPRGLSTPLPIYVKSAQGSELWDETGRQMIDFAGGIGVLNVGHRHPKVIAAARAQLDAFTHTCFQVGQYESYIRLAERLNAITPGDHTKKTMLVTTGAEAVENAIKIARAHTKRPAIIAFSAAFHGRTLMTMALTGKVKPYKVGFGPFPGDVYHVPFPDTAKDPDGDAAFEGIEMLFRSDVDPQRVAAIIIEPVQGEGGFNIAPFPFLKKLRSLCDRHGILFVVDEIQAGFARTGRMFAIEHAGVVPDLITMAKSLGGGFPLAAITGRAEIMDSAEPGGLGGTYAGNPVACAAADAVLDVIVEEKLVERAETLGAKLREGLSRIARRNSLNCIAEIRGLGAMVAMDLVDADGRPDGALAQKLTLKAAEKGLVLLSCGVHGNVIRFLMPLTISDALLEEGVKRLEASLLDVAAPV